jgi:hypothetical protein
MRERRLVGHDPNRRDTYFLLNYMCVHSIPVPMLSKDHVHLAPNYSFWFLVFASILSLDTTLPLYHLKSLLFSMNFEDVEERDGLYLSYSCMDCSLKY